MWDQVQGALEKRGWIIRGRGQGNSRGAYLAVRWVIAASAAVAFWLGALEYHDGSDRGGDVVEPPSRYGFVPEYDATGVGQGPQHFRWRWWRQPRYLANGKTPKNHAGHVTAGLLDDLAARSGAGIDQTVAALRGLNLPPPRPATTQDWINTQATHNMMQQYPSFNPQSWAYALARMPESQNVEDRRDQPNFIQETKPVSNEPLPAKMQDWYKEQWESLRKKAEQGDLDAQRKIFDIMKNKGNSDDPWRKIKGVNTQPLQFSPQVLDLVRLRPTTR